MTRFLQLCLNGRLLRFDLAIEFESSFWLLGLNILLAQSDLTLRFLWLDVILEFSRLGSSEFVSLIGLLFWLIESHQRGAIIWNLAIPDIAFMWSLPQLIVGVYGEILLHPKLRLADNTFLLLLALAFLPVFAQFALIDVLFFDWDVLFASILANHLLQPHDDHLQTFDLTFQFLYLEWLEGYFVGELVLFLYILYLLNFVTFQGLAFELYVSPLIFALLDEIVELELSLDLFLIELSFLHLHELQVLLSICLVPLLHNFLLLPHLL